MYKAKALFGENLKLDKPTVNLKGYNDSPVENLGSCTVYLYHGNTIYRVLCEVADSKGHSIFGRKQALVMEYVSFPEIQKLTVQAKTNKCFKTLEEELAKTTNGPVIPRVQKCTDPVAPVIQKRTQEMINITGKTHSLPTTKNYLPQEYFARYKPIQHPPHQVAISLKPPFQSRIREIDTA